MKKNIKNLSSSTIISTETTDTTIPTITMEMITDTFTETTTDHPEGWKEIEEGIEGTSLEPLPEPTMEPETPIEPKEIRIIEMTGNNGKFKIIHPDDLEPDTDKTPISKRMGELLLIQMDEGTRTSGDHPTIKKHPKWMINPKLNGKERWMDLPKEKGWNLEQRLIILSRNQINFKEMNSHIIGRIQIID